MAVLWVVMAVHVWFFERNVGEWEGGLCGDTDIN
jgi:hypothetical protein